MMRRRCALSAELSVTVFVDFLFFGIRSAIVSYMETATAILVCDLILKELALAKLRLSRGRDHALVARNRFVSLERAGKSALTSSIRYT